MSMLRIHPSFSLTDVAANNICWAPQFTANECSRVKCVRGHGPTNDDVSSTMRCLHVSFFFPGFSTSSMPLPCCVFVIRTCRCFHSFRFGFHWCSSPSVGPTMRFVIWNPLATVESESTLPQSDPRE